MSLPAAPGGGGQGWEQFRAGIEDLFRRRMSRPFWLWNSPTANLPTQAGQGANQGAIAYDQTLNAPAFYDGSAWKSVGVVGGGAALTRTDDTNVTLTLGGTPASALLAATSITVGWAGTLSVARGGTGSGTAAGARNNLGLGTAAEQNTGTSGANVPLLDGTNTWSALQVFGTSVMASGASGSAQINDRTTGGTDAWLWYANSGTLRIFQQNGLADRATFGATGLAVAGSIKPASYTVAGVPSAAAHGAGAMIYVSNESGGAVPAFSDGTDWRRVTDRAVIS